MTHFLRKKALQAMGHLLILSGLLLAQQNDLVYGRLSFRVAPPDPTIRATVEWHFREAYGDTLHWALGAGLEITALRASFVIDTVWRDTARRIVYIRSGQPLTGDPSWLWVEYQGIPRSSGFGSYAVQAHETGWAVWTLSQPYGAPDWLFCQDGLRDKVDSLDMCIITPDTLIGVGNGMLIADSVDTNGWRWRHFRHRYPIAVYLIAFAASNYIIQEYPVQTPYHAFTLRNFVYPQDTARARTLTEQFLPYITWLEARIGPYPFADEDYNQVQIGWRGGMEHQTITFFGSYSLELWAHELAHQWFGDWITCGSWQDIWLNEAFGTYLGGTVYEAVAPQWWQPWLRGIIRSAWRDTTLTVYVEDTTQVGRIFYYPTTYAKAALALHTLRQYVGEEAFWSGLKRYLRMYAGGFARTQDFQQAVEPDFGEEITRAFLESWIYAPHYPRALVRWQDERIITVLPLRPYPMRLPLWVTTADGDTLSAEVDLMGARMIPFGRRATFWEIDPDTLSPYWSDRKGTVLPTELYVYPVPFSDHLIIQGRGLRRVALYDLGGRLIAEYTGAPQDSPLLWQLPELSPGVYVLQAQIEGTTFIRRVLRLSP